MVILLAALLGVFVAGFLLYPLLTEQDRAAYSQELLDRVDNEIEDEVRALRAERRMQR